MWSLCQGQRTAVTVSFHLFKPQPSLLDQDNCTGWKRVAEDPGGHKAMHLLEAERGLSCNLQMFPEIWNVQAVSIRMKFTFPCRVSEQVKFPWKILS